MDEVYPDPRLIGLQPSHKAEARRLVAWFDNKFYDEVTFPILQEKVFKRFMSMGQPQTEVIRAAKKIQTPNFIRKLLKIIRRNLDPGVPRFFLVFSCVFHGFPFQNLKKSRP